MPNFDECCVLVPASTLEDFPNDLSDHDARSLLAGWTVLWHPRLLADQEQMPVWYRADSPPEPLGKRVIVAPAPSLGQLPGGYAARAAASSDCRWILGADRAEMLAALELEDCPSLTSGRRSVSVADFFAAGFASLQIQIMTRRLRYTSNLDEIHLQNRLVQAAKSFVDGQAEETIDALHDVFDCLAEERDHYFSSDPHLIDLLLMTPSTVDRLIESWPSLWGSPPTDVTETATSDSGLLPTPVNLLLDPATATELAKRKDATTTAILKGIRSQTIGWAGGGPDSNTNLDAMTYSQAENSFRNPPKELCDAIGVSPLVYARFAGATPSDMTSIVAKLGYQGMMPLDFSGGRGHGEEAKVLLQTAAGDIEALTAKPIDAGSDASFLAIAARLGEAIDGGEIATGLLVHWPGQGCESYHDLRRVASWSVSLGKFWKIDDYFRDGEHPYHHGTASAASPEASTHLCDAIQQNQSNPISSVADAFSAAVEKDRIELLAGLAGLASGQPSSESLVIADHVDLFAKSVGTRATQHNRLHDPHSNLSSKLVVNPYSVGVRDHVTINGKLAHQGQLYAATMVADATSATVDVPAGGFVVLRPAEPSSGRSAAESKGLGIGKWLRDKWLGKQSTIAEDGRLQNEFMEVTISRDSAGISGVYSGSTRGNRFSMRLIAVGTVDVRGEDCIAQCRQIKAVNPSPELGQIEASGEVVDTKKNVLANFSITYTLRRGSRVIEVDGDITPKVELGEDPWNNYLGARVAVAGEAPICRLLLRDKVHRTSGRRLVAPLGLLVDETDRQTLISSAGMPYHRYVGERFFDTLLCVKGEQNRAFHLRYGFDLPSPVAAAKSLIAPPIQVDIDDPGKAPESGWIMHVSPAEVMVNRLRVRQRTDGTLAAFVQVIQTRPKTAKASLRFFRDVRFASLVDADEQEMLQRPVATEPESGDPKNSDLHFGDDRVSITMPSHGVTDLMVVFDGK